MSDTSKTLSVECTSLLKLIIFYLKLYKYVSYNDGHVLPLRSETVAVHKRMDMVLVDYDGQRIPEGE